MKIIHDFEEWVKAALAHGFHGPARTQGHDTHQFTDDAGNTVAVWHGTDGHGTVPGDAPAERAEPAPAPEAPTETEETHDVQNHTE